ncbi:unnamed protein product [Linum tenue]|uniref:Uncharacterized protein n=1 Tax=Linum tenue TaxID=586396 RepID=A0AAV0HNY0_9ROSI|nr:unnamed protein product [Linum tenue]
MVSTEKVPSLCWDATAPECSGSHVERFISKRIPLILRLETGSWSATSTFFTIDSLIISIIIITIVMFDSSFFFIALVGYDNHLVCYIPDVTF